MFGTYIKKKKTKRISIRVIVGAVCHKTKAKKFPTPSTNEATVALVF